MPLLTSETDVAALMISRDPKFKDPGTVDCLIRALREISRNMHEIDRDLIILKAEVQALKMHARPGR